MVIKKTFYKLAVNGETISDKMSRKKLRDYMGKIRYADKAEIVVEPIEPENIKPSEKRIVQIDNFKKAVERAKAKVEEDKKAGKYVKGGYKIYMKEELKKKPKNNDEEEKK